MTNTNAETSVSTHNRNNGKIAGTAKSLNDNIKDENETRRTGATIGGFLAEVFNAPYLVANTFLTMLAGIAVIAILISGGVAGHFAKLTSGDPLALTLTLATFTALLGGTMGLALLADKRDAQKRIARKVEDKKENRNVQTQLAHSLKEVLQMQQEVSDLIGMVFAQSQATWYRRDNNSASWNAIAAGTDLISIDGFCLAEATATKDADGKLAFSADIELLLNAWLPRFIGNTRLRKVSHMLGVKQGSNDPTMTYAKLLKLIGVYRVLDDIAKRSGKQIDLSSVEIILFDSSLWTYGPTFVGTKKSRASVQERHDFVQRYIDSGLAAANLLNTGVEVSYSSELVGHYKSVANELMSNAQRVLNLEDAERLFGQYVPRFVNGSNTPIVLQPREHKFEIIDHMDGSFSMGDYLI